MLEAIGHILPIALAVAISSVPIMATIAILLSPNRRTSAPPFAFGWIAGMVILVAICTVTAQAVTPPRSAAHPSVAMGTAEIVVGATLVVIALIAWGRARRNPDDALPKWLDKVESLGPWSAFGVAAALNVRPKEILLAIAAGLAIRGAALTTPEAAIAILVYTVLGASTVAVPVVVTLIDINGMRPRLLETKEWVARNNRQVTSLILIFIGVVIIGSGLGRL